MAQVQANVHASKEHLEHSVRASFQTLRTEMVSDVSEKMDKQFGRFEAMLAKNLRTECSGHVGCLDLLLAVLFGVDSFVSCIGPLDRHLYPFSELRHLRVLTILSRGSQLMIWLLTIQFRARFMLSGASISIQTHLRGLQLNPSHCGVISL